MRFEVKEVNFRRNVIYAFVKVCLPLSFVPIFLYVPEVQCRRRPGSWVATLGFLTVRIQTLCPQPHPEKYHLARLDFARAANRMHVHN